MKFKQIFHVQRDRQFFTYEFSKEAKNMLLQLMTDAFEKAFISSVAYPCEIPCDAMEGYDFLLKNILRTFGKTEKDFSGTNSYQKVRTYLYAGNETEIVVLLRLFYGTLFDGFTTGFEKGRTFVVNPFEETETEKLEEYIIREIPDEINSIFKANGLGYRFELTQENDKVSYQIIKKSDEFTYSKVIEPAWSLLKKYNIFKNANVEFTKAMKYIYGSSPDYENVIKESNSAFESVMKVITIEDPQLRNMPSGTAVHLISELVRGNYINPKLQQGFQVLPTFANEMGRHGKGDASVNVNEEDAEFALDLAATYIMFLVKQFLQRNKKI